MKNHSSSLQGDLLVVLAMGLFGGYSLFIRLFPEISPLLFLLAFQIVGLVFFWPMAWRQGFPSLSRHEKQLLTALAVVALGNDLCYFYAFRLTTVANAAVAHQMVSAFLLVFAPLFLGEKTRRNEWIALILGIIGIGVIYSGGMSVGGDIGKHVMGITLGLVSAVFYALLVILYRIIPDAERGRTISAVNSWRFGLSVIILLPMLGAGGMLSKMSWDMLWPMAAFGFLFAFVASGIHNVGLSKARALHSSILGKSEPIFAAMYAAAFLGEIPGWKTIIGGVLIVGSAVWLALDAKEQ